MQIIPIAPQLNAQNVNVLTFDDVNQGNANNANTGQAVQQQNTQTGAASQQDRFGKWTGKGPSQAGSQRNDADQGQVQIIPIAPQLNAQNVNVLTFDDVNQGNANNANTGQAVQQQNTQTGAASQQDTRWTPGDGRSRQGGSWAGQSNDSDQGQVQIIPIAPQLNLQNVNALTFGDVNQGNANNANTGQASQQQNTWVDGGGPRGSKPCESKCDPRPEPTPCSSKCEPRNEPKPCPPKEETKPCPPKHEPKPCPPKEEAKPCPPKEHPKPKPCPPKEQPKPKPCPPKHEPKPCPPKEQPRPCPPNHEDGASAQRNDSDQHQVQVIPIAPQLNLQNVNLLTFGDVTQGNVNNANTGQATQQSNSVGQLVKRAPTGGGLPTVV